MKNAIFVFLRFVQVVQKHKLFEVAYSVSFDCLLYQ